MKKSGFTLVEMLAVVVILGVILIVAIPQIQNQLSGKKDAVHEATLQIIYDAAEDFTSADPSTFQKMYNDEADRSSYCITLQELVDAGKLEAPIKNYSNGKEIDLSYIVRAVTNQYNEFEYTFVESADCQAGSTELIYYYDTTLKDGSTPALYPGMIPVVYKNGYWVKASMYEAWYSYAAGENMWANVVTVNKDASTCKDDCIDTAQKHSRSYYQEAVAGTKISMDDINGMYVWIPKYEYKITAPYGTGSEALSATAPGAIDVNFVEKTATTASSGYTIHPAFTFGGKQLGGIWVAKFEASATPTTEGKYKCAYNSDTANCNNSITDVMVVPNRNSWKYISIGNAYQAVSLMSSSTSYNGLTGSTVDTHLMKNTEWGAVAYLSQSKYGQYGREGKEVFVNMYYNQGTLTGCTNGASGTGLKQISTCESAKKEKLNYNYEATYRGSTSGTIYGIFDMAGGAWEYVMGNYKRIEASGGIALENHYETQTDIDGNEMQVLTAERISDKYINIYTSTSCPNNECQGAALLKSEFASSIKKDNWWLDMYDFDENDMLASKSGAENGDSTWLIRGGAYNLTNSSLIGIFAVSHSPGAPNDFIGFRPVITGIK